MSTKTDTPDAPSTELVDYDPTLFRNLPEADPRKVTERFAQRFMEAETLDDLFDALSGQNSKGLVGKTVTITGVDWQWYLSERGKIPNAICQAAIQPDGEAATFATTSAALTMFIRRAELLGAIPFTAKIVGVKTNSGQTALNFERA